VAVADFPHHNPVDGQIRRRRSLTRHMVWDADLPGDLVERLWRNPHGLLGAGRKLHDKPRCTVVHIHSSDGSHVFKYLNWGSRVRRVKKSLSRSSGRKSWIDGLYLLAAGIPTPRPRAYVERRLGPFSTCSYLLTDYVPGKNLYRVMRFHRPSSELVGHLARQLASIWQQLYDLRVSHNDFKTENLIVDPQGKLWLIDVEKMRRCGGLSRTRRKQARDAGDLLHPRNWRSDPGAAEVFRGEILKTAAAAETLASLQGGAHPLRRKVPRENRQSQLVTVLIPCRNAAQTIAGCLASVRDMADEILVADGGSTDDTLRCVRQAGGCRIVQRERVDDADFESWASRTARHPWILRVLPDERLNPELGRQVQDLLATEPAEDGFEISRTVFFRGRRLKYGGFQHDKSVRLYRKNAALYVLRAGRVEVLVPSEKVGRITSRMLCETGLSFERHLADMIRLAGCSAKDARRQGCRPKRRAALWHAPWQFVRSYLLRFGCLDGWPGLHACWLSALSVYLREAMLWELDQSVTAPGSADPGSRRTLNVFDDDSAPVAAQPASATIPASSGVAAIATHCDPRRKRPAA